MAAAATRTTTSADGTPLAYEVHGDGPPLVYVTGAICHRRFGPVRSGTKVISKAFRVLSYDRRGRGDSGDTGPWSLDKEVEDIAALVGELGGRASIYGHSSGGVLALHAALALGDRVDRVVVYDASWAADDAEESTYAVLRSEVAERLDRGRPREALQHFLAGIGMPRALVSLLPFMPGWQLMRAIAPTLHYDMELTAHQPPVDVLAAIDVPVHVVVGGRSPSGLHAVARSVADAIPGATHEVLAGQDHMVAEKVLLPSLRRALDPACSQG